WVRQRPSAPADTSPGKRSMPVSSIAGGGAAASPAPGAPAPAARRKLGFKEARELEQLPGTIESLEKKLAAMTAEMNDPAFYQRDATAITAHTAEVGKVQAELDAAYARWAELDG